MNKPNIIIEFESGKKVELRAVQIRDVQNASASAAKHGQGDAMAFQIALQSELLKILLVKINDQPLSATEKEALDDHLELSEYMALQAQMQELVGNAKVRSRSFAGISGSK